MNSNNKLTAEIATKFAKEGFLTNNPILIQGLGMCPTLATTTSVPNGIGMGLSAAAVLICSNLLISLLRKFIPKQIRIAAYIVVIAGFVTALEMILKAYIPALNKSLGLFIPLIVVNCIILARAETFASKNGPASSVLDGVFMGLGFAFALFLLAAIREILGAGTFCGIKLFSSDVAAKMFVSPPGAFIALGILIAAFKTVTGIINKKSSKNINNINKENEPDTLSTKNTEEAGS
ncbi:MAG: electron transport complex subunit RsxE [Oscillospiraceae bacterium]|nr:electron transport complex subunit RsxE [Oscillospiraceae bacterium]